MDDFTLAFIKKKLILVSEEKEAEKIINSALTMAGLTVKNYYSREEIDAILDEMIRFGGFAEFVGRNIKIELILNVKRDITEI